MIQHGTPEQLERWIRPSLDGDLYWCQLFSEPNAGSDAAAIQTARHARRRRLAGQRPEGVDQRRPAAATWGSPPCAPIRTRPSTPASSTFAIDLRAKGVEVRPLREITGESLFNEVFFDDVFVPDDDVVGDDRPGLDGGPRHARQRARVDRRQPEQPATPSTTTSSWPSPSATRPAITPSAIEVGEALAESHAMSALNLRHVMRAVIGAGPGPEGAVTKLLSAEHAQRVSSLALRIAGEAGIADGEPAVRFQYLFDRCLTIAGGTSEIVRNVIAERILGLPRDPLAK